jgi:hypothetical protein
VVLRSGLSCRNCPKDQREERGCEFDSPIPGRWQIEDFVFQRCPVKITPRESFEYLQAYGLYKDGFLPSGNGWINESPKFIQAMLTIEKQLAKEVKDARQ